MSHADAQVSRGRDGDASEGMPVAGDSNRGFLLSTGWEVRCRWSRGS